LRGVTLDRNSISRRICARLDAQREMATGQWRASSAINHFVVDDVLPEDWALQIRAAFPPAAKMTLKSSLRERKYVAAQMNQYSSLLEEAIFAFQMPEVVALIEQITQLRRLEPDTMLYAGGVSLMSPGHFLNPHIDNSHDRTRERYRVLNLLYYVSPQWSEEHGANLELWPSGPRGEPRTIASRFNRLVVMLTHSGSWHSVSPNRSTQDRCCVSNYYFSSTSVSGDDYYHVTEFRGRPDQPVRDTVLRADNWLRTFIRTRFPKAFGNPHFYDKPQPK
jgi:Rps23 Pro-64 3,4-dihydroxylase Tpa1-like proline 4-hydroxylase